MPNPNKYDQPAEGGVEQVEHTLQKQSEPKENRKGNKHERAQETPEHRTQNRPKE